MLDTEDDDNLSTSLLTMKTTEDTIHQMNEAESTVQQPQQEQEQHQQQQPHLVSSTTTFSSSDAVQSLLSFVAAKGGIGTANTMSTETKTDSITTCTTSLSLSLNDDNKNCNDLTPTITIGLGNDDHYYHEPNYKDQLQQSNRTGTNNLSKINSRTRNNKLSQYNDTESSSNNKQSVQPPPPPPPGLVPSDLKPQTNNNNNNTKQYIQIHSNHRTQYDTSTIYGSNDGSLRWDDSDDDNDDNNDGNSFEPNNDARTLALPPIVAHLVVEDNIIPTTNTNNNNRSAITVDTATTSINSTISSSIPLAHATPLYDEEQQTNNKRYQEQQHRVPSRCKKGSIRGGLMLGGIVIIIIILITGSVVIISNNNNNNNNNNNIQTTTNVVTNTVPTTAPTITAYFQNDYGIEFQNNAELVPTKSVWVPLMMKGSNKDDDQNLIITNTTTNTSMDQSNNTIMNTTIATIPNPIRNSNILPVLQAQMDIAKQKLAMIRSIPSCDGAVIMYHFLNQRWVAVHTFGNTTPPSNSVPNLTTTNISNAFTDCPTGTVVSIDSSGTIVAIGNLSTKNTSKNISSSTAVDNHTQQNYKELLVTIKIYQILPNNISIENLGYTLPEVQQQQQQQQYEQPGRFNVTQIGNDIQMEYPEYDTNNSTTGGVNSSSSSTNTNLIIDLAGNGKSIGS